MRYGRITRLGVRILLGFGIYFALSWLWLAASLDAAYDRFVLFAALHLLPALTHFPLGASTFDPLSVHNQGYALVLLLSLFLVSGRIPPLRRTARFSLLALLVVVAQILGLALQLRLELAVKFQAAHGLPLLLPWELAILTRAVQFLFLFGLQTAPFLFVVLTAYWNSEGALAALFSGGEAAEGSRNAARSPARGRRTVALLLLCGVGLTSAAAFAWWRRETDPRHVRVHAVIGTAFLAGHRFAEAERQYRAAVRGGTRDGEVWARLAALLARRGRRDEAVRLIDRGLGIVQDPDWRVRLERLRAELRGPE